MDPASTFDRAHIVHIPDGSALSELDRRLIGLGADVTRNASAIVFRVDSVLREDLIGPDGGARRYLLSRAAALPPIAFVTYSDVLTTHQLWLLSQDNCVQVEIESAVSAVRRNGLRQLVDSAIGYCYLSSTPAYHFITPSNRHTSVFLRVADSLTSTEVLDQYAFWLMPYLRGAELVLVDNWSIAAIVIRTLQSLNSPAYFECFSNHPLHDRLSAEATIDRLLAHRTGAGKIACVLSVTGSGTVTDLFLDLFRARGVTLAGDAVVSIFAFANAPVSGTVLCRLNVELEHFPSGECPHCEAKVPAITIDQHGYYLKGGQEHEGILTSQLVTQERPLLSVHGTESALRLHRFDPNDGRHHGFDIDVMTLLKQPSFQARLIQSTRTLPKPDVILAPDHDAGRAMALTLRECTTDYVVIANRLNTVALSVADRERLTSAKHLLILDDVINSGSRLERYIEELRRTFPRIETVSILVGVVRTDSEDCLRRITNCLKSSYTKYELVFVEKLFLPAWDEKLCPWCQEHTFLAGVANRVSEPPEWLLRRVGELADTKAGVCSPLLVLPDTPIPTLGAGSFVATEGTTALSLSFHLSSALQRLRMDVEVGKRLMPEFPVQRIFAARNLELYSEPLLRALFVRLIRPTEWGSANRLKVREQLIRYISDDRHAILLGEVLLAMARGVIAPVGRAQFDHLFGSRLGPLLPVVRDVLRISSRSDPDLT
jgi:hypothetical protein